MKIEPKAFIAIEKTMASALHAEWGRIADALLPELRSAVEKGDWAGAETLANSLTLKGVVQKVRPKLEEMAVSALLFGAHRVTKDVRQTAFVKGKAIPAELQNALTQLEHAVEHDASDTIRKKLHEAIAKLKRGDARAHMQKHDLYTEPDERPDHQTAEEFPPEPDEDGETMRDKEKDAQAGRWAKGDISDAQLAETGGLLEPEQGERKKGKGRLLTEVEVRGRARKGDLTLYVHRDLLNVGDVLAWAKSQGLASAIPDMHVTVCYSKAPVDWSTFEPKAGTLVVPEGHDRKMEMFGDAFVLQFGSEALEDDHKRFRAGGASHDFDTYRPHLTISYAPGDTSRVEPYHGPLVFGPEMFEPVKSGWADDIVEQAVKADVSLADQLNAVIQKGAKPPIDLEASLTSSRLVTLGFLTQAQQDGHTQYQVDEVLDEKTCPVCLYMNGKTFDVAQQYSRTIQCLSASDPMDLKDLAPWPEDASDVMGMDPDELQSSGYGAPPYHPGCRGMLSLAGEVDENEPLGGLIPEGEDDELGAGAEPDSAAGADESSGWTDDEVQQLGWDRFEVTDPEVFSDVDAAFAAEDYDQAQALIDKWKDDNGVQKAEAQLVALDRIKTVDPAHDDPRVEKTRRRIRAGKEVKPIDLHSDGEGGYVVVNGEHRLAAHKLEGKTHIRALIGGPEDAQHERDFGPLGKEDEFEGPNAPKKKRRNQTPAGQLAMDHDDIASDSSSIAFDSGVMNDMNAPIDRG